MTSAATTVDQYINEAPEDRREALQKLRNVILENLPEGFLLNFTPKEFNYAVSYSHKSQTWTYESSRQIQTIGIIYTNSLSCIDSVVALLNDNEFTL